jgi:hypothetical protein
MESWRTTALGIWTFSAILSLATSTQLHRSDGPASSRKLPLEVNMGTASIRLSDSCFVLNARLSAGDFFEGIEVSQTASGRQYHKGATALSVFPSKLKIRILAWPRNCTSPGMEVPAQSESVLQGLTLKAEWKTELKARPVGKVSTALRALSNQEWSEQSESKRLEDLGLPPLDPENKGIWLMEATIEDEKVPLTDSLTVSLFSDKGKLAARFSARL